MQNLLCHHSADRELHCAHGAVGLCLPPLRVDRCTPGSNLVKNKFLNSFLCIKWLENTCIQCNTHGWKLSGNPSESCLGKLYQLLSERWFLQIMFLEHSDGSAEAFFFFLISYYHSSKITQMFSVCRFRVCR